MQREAEAKGTRAMESDEQASIEIFPHPRPLFVVVKPFERGMAQFASGREPAIGDLASPIRRP
jgi:hypothetical protein